MCARLSSACEFLIKVILTEIVVDSGANGEVFRGKNNKITGGNIDETFEVHELNVFKILTFLIKFICSQFFNSLSSVLFL